MRLFLLGRGVVHSRARSSHPSFFLSLPTHPLPHHTVLGRFVYALNQYCKDVHAMEYDVEDYWVYEFAKVRLCSTRRPTQRPPND